MPHTTEVLATELIPASVVVILGVIVVVEAVDIVVVVVVDVAVLVVVVVLQSCSWRRWVVPVVLAAEELHMVYY